MSFEFTDFMFFNFFLVQMNPNRVGLRRALFKMGRALANSNSGREVTNDAIALGCEYNHPLSRGSIRLRSADPRQPPLIDPAWLRDERDVTACVQILKKMYKISQTGPLKKYFSVFGHLPKINSKMLGLFRREDNDEVAKATDEQWREFLLQTAITTWHYASSARMGPADGPVDQFACDPRLRVRGVSGVFCLCVCVSTYSACVCVRG